MPDLTACIRAIPVLFLVALLSGCNLPAPTADAQPSPSSTPIVERTRVPTVTLPAPVALLSDTVAAVLPEVTLDVELFYADHWMRVHQTVDMENTSPDEWTEVVFNIPIHSVPDAFFLDSLSVELGQDVQEGTPSLFGQETILRVPLPHPAQPGEIVHLEMGYRVVIPPVEPTDWPPIGTTGWTDNLIQAGEWYPSLVPYVDGQGWHTWQYHPVGDPTIYPLTNVSLTVTTQPGVTVASGGMLGEEDGVWRFHVDAARGIAFLASNRYQVAEGSLDGITLRSYYLPNHAGAGEAALDIASDAIRLFSEVYGPCPYDSLAIAENGFYGGMEYSELVSITDYGYSHYTGQPNSVLHVLVAHEIAHQWWYGAVGNDQTQEPWLDESLAFYGELLYIERYYPEYVDWWWEKRVDIYNPYGPVDATIYSYERSDYFIPSMYGQAARFLRELRNIMGDDDFFAFLRDYYATYRGRFVTAQDFFDTIRRHFDGDLGPLQRAYFANTTW